MKGKIILIIIILVLIFYKVILGLFFGSEEELDNKEKIEIVEVKEDTIPPVLELKMSKLRMEQNTEINYEYFISKARDNIDGSLKSKVIYNTIDTTKTGEFLITYSVEDSSGNKTTKDLSVTIYESSENCCDFSPQEEWIEAEEEKQFNKGKEPKNKKFYIKDYKSLQQANLKAKEYGDSYGIEYKIETGNDGQDHFKVIFKK